MARADRVAQLAPAGRSGRRCTGHDAARRLPGTDAAFPRALRAGDGVVAGRLDPDDGLRAPYPPYVASGAGLVVRDVDGNTYRDFLGNYTSLILGHAHPAVVAAVEAQVRRGSAFAAPTETEIELAEELRRRVPSIERVRFTSSGTEATMFAIRAARAFTGRTLVAKFERSYHGTHDGVMAGTPGVPDAMSGSSSSCRGAIPTASSGACAAASATWRRSSSSRSRAPAASGRPEPRFLPFLRDLADRARRAADLRRDHLVPGRARRRPGASFGVRPDLTTLGKIIGGGYPLAAFGGRADVMAIFDARRPGAVSHGGTFNGSPVAAAAGLATLRELTPDDLRPARRPRRAARGRAVDRRRSSGRTRRPGRRSSGRCSRSSPGQRRRRRSRRASPAGRRSSSASCSRASTLAPRGMGAIPAIATATDVDDLAAAVGRVLGPAPDAGDGPALWARPRCPVLHREATRHVPVGPEAICYLRLLG